MSLTLLLAIRQQLLVALIFSMPIGGCFGQSGLQSPACCRLAKERDLEGIDVSNIVSGDRRARRSAAVAAPVNYAASDKSSSSDEASSSADEQDSSREESDVAASDDEGMSKLSCAVSRQP